MKMIRLTVDKHYLRLDHSIRTSPVVNLCDAQGILPKVNFIEPGSKEICVLTVFVAPVVGVLAS